MINGFEELTQPLSDFVINVTVPRVVNILKRHIGAENAITNKDIRECLSRAHGDKISDVCLRAVINHIRTTHTLDNVVAGANGYYIATSVEEVENYCRSLAQRECAIKSVRLALMDGIDGRMWL